MSARVGVNEDTCQCVSDGWVKVKDKEKGTCGCVGKGWVGVLDNRRGCEWEEVREGVCMAKAGDRVNNFSDRIGERTEL